MPPIYLNKRREKCDFQWLVDIYILSYTMKKNGLSLFEIIIATFLLAITLLSLGNIFVSANRNILHTRCQTAASEVGKFFLERLHMDVRQDTWAVNCLGSGAGCFASSLMYDGISYSPVYTITSIGLIRKVRLDVRWNE